MYVQHLTLVISSSYFVLINKYSFSFFYYIAAKSSMRKVINNNKCCFQTLQLNPQYDLCQSLLCSE